MRFAPFVTSHSSRFFSFVSTSLVAFIAVFGAAIVVFTGSAAGPETAPGSAPEVSSKRQHDLASAYGKLPLSFARNSGQVNERVRFIARGLGYGLFLSSDEAVLVLRAADAKREALDDQVSLAPEKKANASDSQVLRMKLVGANRKVRIEGIDETPGKLNYFIGKDSRKWQRNVPTYAQVRYRNAYPGIDLVYHGNQQQLEYDFLVAPGASPERIRIAFAGAQKTFIDKDGSLVLSTTAGDVRQHKPVAYQEIKGERREVAVNYKLNAGQVSFETGDYDKHLPLVIDPVLVYSSFLGGSDVEEGHGIALDAQGSAYLTGYTGSIDFPVPGGFQTTLSTNLDAFVVKLNPSGTALVYGTYLGGSQFEAGNAIAVDAQGSAYVVGYTYSPNFPTTVGAIQSSLDGSYDAFVTKLSPNGANLTYSTYLGGPNPDSATGVAVDDLGRAHVVGNTESTGFQTLPFPGPRNGHPVYKSTNSASSWSVMESGLTASFINSLTIDPNNSNTIYAATAFGIFKTIDAGAHWNFSAGGDPTLAKAFVYTVAVDPSNSSIVYAGTQIGLFKSTDGGATYVAKTNGIGNLPVRSLAIDPVTPATVYAGMGLGILYKTTNGGDNWTQMRSGIFGGPRVNKVVIDPTNPATVYLATGSGVYKTINGASTWTSMNSGISSNPNITSIAMDPTNTSTLYASGGVPVQRMYKTTTGGASWSPSATGLPFNTIRALVVDPVTPATLYVAADGAGIFKSIDAAANWSASNTNLSNLITMDVVVDGNNPSNLYVGTVAGSDIFAAKFDPSGAGLEYLANFGGSEIDEAHGVALGTNEYAYIVGFTDSLNFPVLNAYQPASGGLRDAFVTKLNSSGDSFGYSTYLGGDQFDYGQAIAVNGSRAYVTGTTFSPNFPVVNPIKPAPTTFDADAFVTKFSQSGATLDYSTCVGGGSEDLAYGLALDGSGNVYVTGFTSSVNFPVVDFPQPQSAGSVFVSKINAAGSAYVYSTYFTGSHGSDQGNGIAVDATGNAYLTGTTYSSNFPTTAGAFQPMLKGTSDAFVTKIGIQADASITKQDSRDPVMVNNPLTYTLNVSNAGPSIATVVTVTDQLPAGVTFGSANSTQGSCAFNSGIVTCNVGTLAASAGAIITIAVTPNTVATISNTATVAAQEETSGANNSATQTTKVSASPSINGRVTLGASGVSGVLMTLSGSLSATTLTDSNGFYQFAELPAGGNFTVTPSKANLSFNPASQTFNPLNADQTADFVASTCTFSIAPASQSVSGGGGNGSVNVTALQGCPWTAVSNANWITITSGASGVGNGTVNFMVSPTSAPRVGHLTIAGIIFPVYQEFNSCATPAFAVATYNIGDSPNITRVADLNGDGRTDIFLGTSALSGGGIGASVMLNDGSGSFTSSTFNTGLGTPTGFVLADFNSDGKPDVAGNNYNNPSVRIFFNNGSGGFGQSNVDVPFDSQGQSPGTIGVLTADLNNDGKADLLVPAPFNNKAQILLGNGNGTFSQVAPVSFSSNLALSNTGDFNNDGFPDLFLAAGNASTPIGVMLGNGNGTFGAAITSSGIDSSNNTHAFGDFDGDGNLDLVLPTTITVNSPPSSFSGLVVMSGDGAGHFVKKSTLSVDINHVGPMTTGDFDNDGKTDLAYSSAGTTVKIFRGDGAAGWQTPIQVDTGGNPNHPGNSGLAAADFNADGRADLAVANLTIGAHVLRNLCSTAAISGRITDSRGGRGLEGVGITLGPLQVIRTYTDSGGNYFIGNLTAGGNYDVVPSKENFKFNPPSITFNNLTGSQTANFVGTPTVVQFTAIHYLVQENARSVQINVSRTGDLSGVATVNYTTVNGTASDRSDFTAAVGTLRFNPGEALKSFNVLITDDALIEGFEGLRLVLSNASGALLATPQVDSLPSDVLMEIQDNDSIVVPNPIVFDPQFFVRQHYHDFLNREPDDAGLNFWVDQIESCGADAACREVKRINVSAAFFLSIEFQETGYLAYRMYNAAYGETTSPNVAGTVPIIRLQEFLPDSQQIGLGVQVGVGNWQQQLEDNKTAYAVDFVRRQRFINAFPLTMTATEFVNKLDQNTNGVLSAAEKSQLIGMLLTPSDAGQRGAVVRKVAEDSDLKQRELNRAFVLMQFYGYLRRNPDDPQDTDFRGWKFWLDKLNEFHGNFVDAEMVKAFLVSAEYRQRFGTP